MIHELIFFNQILYRPLGDPPLLQGEKECLLMAGKGFDVFAFLMVGQQGVPDLIREIQNDLIAALACYQESRFIEIDVIDVCTPPYIHESMVLDALNAGKHVVTSNKALVAAHGIELAQLAREKGVSFLFSAACGGGVPFLHNLAIAAQSDKILSLGGILNGTTNFMLDAMQSEGKDYGDVLKQAQALGYAEADPTADVSGLDALRKIMLACAVAYDKLPVDGFSREGIESITAADVADFQSRGLTCRLITSGGEAGSSVYAYVEPVLFPANAPECSVVKNFNMAKYNGENAGAIVLMSDEAIRKYGVQQNPIRVIDYAAASLSPRKPWCFHNMNVEVRKQLDKNGFFRPEEMDLMITTCMSSGEQTDSAEVFGYIPEGQGLQYEIDGRTAFDGDTPVNPHGGDCQWGHAMGCSGINMLSEAVFQMRGTAGDAQVQKDIKKTLVRGMGGGHTTVGIILQNS